MLTVTPEVWIGLAEVRQRPGAGVLLDRNAAAVNVLALAADAQGFTAAATSALGKLGFDLVDMEDAEPLRLRVQKYSVDEALLTLAKDVERTRRPMFGTFHTWISDE